MDEKDLPIWLDAGNPIDAFGLTHEREQQLLNFIAEWYGDIEPTQLLINIRNESRTWGELAYMMIMYGLDMGIHHNLRCQCQQLP